MTIREAYVMILDVSIFRYLDFDGLVQDCSISIANALKFCTKPSI